MLKPSKQILKFKDGDSFPVGTKFELEIGEKLLSVKAPNGKTYKLRYSRANTYFGAPFVKCPSAATLDKWGGKGNSKSVTGKRCEQDGFSDDGAPSWFLVLSLI